MDKNNKMELVEVMFRISRLLKREMCYQNDLIHLSILQIQTLIFLNHNKKVSMGDIAQYFHIELSSATSLLNKLCDQKIVERQTDGDDRRLVRVTLTKTGKALLDKAVSERRKKIQKILSYLSEKEKNDLLSIMKTLEKNLNK